MAEAEIDRETLLYALETDLCVSDTKVFRNFVQEMNPSAFFCGICFGTSQSFIPLPVQFGVIANEARNAPVMPW